jgi:zinc protease
MQGRTVSALTTPELPLMPDVEHGRLENGIEYFILPRQAKEGQAIVSLSVRVGSAHEEEDERGLAHYLEHIVFSRTEHFPEPNSMTRYFESQGCAFGAHQNASTSFDRTIYWLDIPSGKPGILEKSFQALGDIAGRAHITQETVDAERNIILDERRRGLNTKQAVADQLLSHLYNGTALHERQPIGTKEVIENASAHKLEGFYRRWYQPEQMAVIVVGDVDSNDAKRLIKEQFAGLRAHSAERSEQTVAVQDLPQKQVFICDPDLHGTQVSLYLKQAFPQGYRSGYTDIKHVVLNEMAMILLNTHLAEQCSYLHGLRAADCTISAPCRTFEVVEMTGIAHDGQAREALDIMLSAAERLRRYGVHEKKWEAEKKDQLLAWRREAQQTAPSSNTRLCEDLQEHFLDGDPCPGEAKLMDVFCKTLEDLSLEEINAHIAQNFHFIESDLIAVLQGDDLGMEDEPERGIREVIQNVGQRRLSPHTHEEASPFAPEGWQGQGLIVEEIQHPTSGASTLYFANGVCCTVLKNTQRPGHIALHGSIAGGTANLGAQYQAHAALTEAWLDAVGIGACLGKKVDEHLAEKRMTLTRSLGKAYRQVMLSGPRDELETGLGLIHQLFESDPDNRQAFEVTKQVAHRLGKARERKPDHRFQEDISRLNASEHPAALFPAASDYLDLDYSDFLELAQSTFQDAKGFHFVLAGDIDLNAQVKSLLANSLGCLPTGRGHGAWTQTLKPAAFPAGVTERTVYLGRAPSAEFVLSFPAPEAPSHKTFTLSKFCSELINRCLLRRLRFEDGESYTTKSISSYPFFPDLNHGSTRIEIGCKPAKLDSMQQTVFDELKKLLKEGPPAEELDALKAIWRRELREEAGELSEDLVKLVTYAALGWSYEEIHACADWLEELDLDVLQPYLADIIQLDNYTLVRRLPENHVNEVTNNESQASTSAH